MIKTRNIRPVTEFARNTREHIKRLRRTGEPEVLTVNGQAAVIVQDAEAYQKLLDLVDYIDTVRVLRKRLEMYKKDRRSRPMLDAIDELSAATEARLKRK